MRALTSLLILAALTAGCGAPPAATPGVEVAEALCRPTPNGRDLTGCYLTLTAATDDRLTAVTSPAAAQGQIHEVTQENGLMTMRELPDGLPLAAGRAVALKPGSDHLMLLGLAAPLVQGDTVSLTLSFEKAPPVTVTARVAQPPLPGAA
ncbi:MAG: copper chaperone PCu(A)C [Brevundimonas sp.]|uniref:copper chaperone PCu(A)C n=1 Tax=Brevundimonas sp. TaxID=1871086 RepID=UPI0025C6E06B|nr:copper chaperone PCu(A)C [Brevundimonas sp.]MBX3478532.1 copper chaperone PCu(A)C [Brevundimonas sp.]